VRTNVVEVLDWARQSLVHSVEELDDSVHVTATRLVQTSSVADSPRLRFANQRRLDVVATQVQRTDLEAWLYLIDLFFQSLKSSTSASQHLQQQLLHTHIITVEQKSHYRNII